MIVKDSISPIAEVSSSPWSTLEDTSEPLDDAYQGDLKRSGELTIDEISLLADNILDPNRSFDLHSESSSNLTNETSQWSKEYDLVLIKSIEKSTVDCGIKEASNTD